MTADPVNPTTESPESTDSAIATNASDANAPAAKSPPKARVVKAEHAEPKPLYPVARLIKGAVLEAEELRTQARQLLQDAEAEAQRLVREANDQAQKELADARQRGFDKGFAKFHELIRQASNKVDAMSAQFGGEVTSAAFRLASEILDAELKSDPQRIIQVIATGLEHLRSRFPKRVAVHLHPDDFDLVETNKAAFTGIVSDDVQFGFVKDSDIKRHQVIMETEMGHYDFSVESQLEELRRVIHQTPDA